MRLMMHPLVVVTLNNKNSYQKVYGIPLQADALTDGL